jgi:hypothetical protein
MKIGKISYICRGKKSVLGRRPQSVLLTLIASEDEDAFLLNGIRGVRLKRLLRITREADMQGCRLCYDDLSALLLSSLATLKRDVAFLEAKGEVVPLKGRRKARMFGSEISSGEKYELQRVVA